MDNNIIVGTAGHIDHGKTTLIKALTGEDTDRLLEEKERGISIELGFTHLQNEETDLLNLNLGIVDVPGHQKFVNKMLAAAGGIDLALIVVAADEGVMPQTKEHLSILELMGAEKAIIVISKKDLVDYEWLELVKLDILDQFENTFAENAEMITVSAVNGEGIAELKTKIIELASNTKVSSNSEIPYYPIDRVFSLKGQGTVVTGTLFKGELFEGQELELYPSAKKLKIKSMESHQKKLKKVSSGSRVGINLNYPDKNEIKRGDVISTADSLISTNFLEAKLKVLNSINFKIENGDRIHFHTGTTEVMGTINLYGEQVAFPGDEIFIKIKLDHKISPYYRQKFVIRRFSPLDTIGGGEILEIDPPPRRKINPEKLIAHLNLLEEADLKTALELFIKNKTGSAAELIQLKKKTALKIEKILELLSDLKEENKIFELKNDSSFIHTDNFKKVEKDIKEIVNDYHQQHRLEAGITREEIRSRLDFDLTKKELDQVLEILTTGKLLQEKDSLITASNFRVQLTEKEKKQKQFILDKINSNYFSPPTRKELLAENENLEAVINYLEDNSEIVRLDQELYFDKDIFSKLQKLLRKYFRENESIELAEFRDLINSSRRYALVLLEKCDQLQLTLRRGDLRYPGKNL
ncbi:selenocysteine-specific translation elongation factor SelB [Halanaerobium saccharolyticum]|uniref:Selenocysteine-specific elongation factor n=1 Tax=Halanaerobium saccharolyticum TaxID=43595 RepID=A0A2T5RNP0_9FIRM|nr:selenocysteine-specific translation elongation factor [Halanaerobium saccharolyticum]PTW01291.1 selenocysteine-specific translation elongation factor SelB [Halanaerobium saccharolyticum]